MDTFRCRFAVLCGVLAVLVGYQPALAASADQASQSARDILNVGEPGPRAIGLTIRTDTPEGQPLKAGDSVVLHVKASRECYIAAIYISAHGDAVILFPNDKTPDNFVKPDKEYTLFGKDSGISLKVGDKMKQGHIVFFASSQPFNTNPLKAVDGKACVTVAPRADEDIRVLKSKIDTLAKDEGFNKIVLQLKAEGAKGNSFNLMGLPSSVSSDKPEGITGVQGLKGEDVKR